MQSYSEIIPRELLLQWYSLPQRCWAISANDTSDISSVACYSLVIATNMIMLLENISQRQRSKKRWLSVTKRMLMSIKIMCCYHAGRLYNNLSIYGNKKNIQIHSQKVTSYWWIRSFCQTYCLWTCHLTKYKYGKIYFFNYITWHFRWENISKVQ